SRWFALEDRLGRFFGPGLEACLEENGANALNICFRQPCP
ncbi:MAG: DUF2854 domain-containing protein, partial [Synechococcaceae bacterium WBB_32_011]|nr:DUF2854 domain-containing protein [Synechococcaceae bacterium WBB_32_011]